MLANPPLTPAENDNAAGRWVWAFLLVAGSVLLSAKFSCATPFAALATLAAVAMNRREGIFMVVAAWAANQIVGYGLLGYPHEFQSYAWGALVGVAAVAGYFAARFVAARVASLGLLPAIASALVASFAAYEAVLIAGTALLPSGEEAFSLPIIGEIALANGLAFVAILLVHHLISTSGWLPQISRQRLAA